jgi:isopentenyl-diphosphate delta-isomerase
MPSRRMPGMVQPPPDLLVLVDERDRVLGFREKDACHDAGGVLHRAFSVLIFDDRGRVLLQRRSARKRLWPLRWSNSCCSHPRKGETIAAAARRRLREELGMVARLKVVGRVRYRFRYGRRGAENELTAVLLGRSRGVVVPDPDEVADWKWVDAVELQRDLVRHPRRYTPWFRLEWDFLRREHGAELRRLLAG